MSLDSDSFVALCERLRAMGAVKVEGYGFSATFVPTPAPATAQPLQRKLAAKPAPTEPTDADFRELQRKHELGLV